MRGDSVMVRKQYLNRRKFIRRIAAGAGALFVPLGGCISEVAGRRTLKATRTSQRSAASQSSKRPNIVFIIADDLGWADVGYHGSEIKTPNIDRLARQGVRFDQHYVAPTCTPTRVGLMTGRYPSRFGVVSPAYGKIFDDDTITLAMALRSTGRRPGDSGYDTVIAGKWHMGSPPEYTPLKYGFNSSYGYFHGQIDPYTHLYKTGVRSWHRNDQYLDEEGHVTDLITDEAIRVIISRRDKPFFLYIAYSVPHYPLDELDEWTSIYAEQIDQPSRRWFAASVTHMDYGIGRIVDALNRTGQRENTLIVFVSDNGGQKSWHSATQYKGRYASKPHTVLGNNHPLRGWKGEVYEGGIRVPAFANWPGVLKRRKVTSPVHIVDWMPTLCQLAEYSPKMNLNWDGRDIWPLICGQTIRSILRSSAAAKDEQEPRTFYWKTPRQSAVRRGDWKSVFSEDGKKVELYNLSADPLEKKDLARQYPQRVSELKVLLAELAKNDRARN
jgi:arylsulfatase A-like enzyme